MQELENRTRRKRNVHEIIASRNDLDRYFHPGQQKYFFAKGPDGKLARRISKCTHRRWGKSEGCFRYAGLVAEEKPKARMAYVVQQRLYAKRLAWPILKELDDRFEWGLEFHNVDLTATWPSGAWVELFGADDERFARLMRGPKYDLVIIDEAQNFIYSDLENICGRILGLTIADTKGRMLMVGTPGDVNLGFFWEITCKGKHIEWVDVPSGRFENPHTEKELKEELEEYRKSNPDIEKEPWIKREFFGQWAVDNRRMVIKLHPGVNYLYAGEWEPNPADRYLLGIDFGFSDPSAYVIAVENPEMYPYLVYLEGFEATGMLLQDHINKLREYQGKYTNLRMAADPHGHAKALLEELKDSYGFPIEDAKKQEKRFHVERLNSEATLGKIKIYNLDDPSHPENSPVAKQWNSLLRIPTGELPLEQGGEWDEGRPRHTHDASVYARRLAILRGYRERKEVPYGEMEENRMFRASIKQARGKRRVR